MSSGLIFQHIVDSRDDSAFIPNMTHFQSQAVFFYYQRCNYYLAHTHAMCHMWSTSWPAFSLWSCICFWTIALLKQFWPHANSEKPFWGGTSFFGALKNYSIIDGYQLLSEIINNHSFISELWPIFGKKWRPCKIFELIPVYVRKAMHLKGRMRASAWN